MIHKIPLADLFNFINTQPDEKRIVMNQNLGVVENIEHGCFLFQFVKEKLKSSDFVSAGYSSILVRGGDTYELGTTTSERQACLDLNLACIQKPITNFGELKESLNLLHEGKLPQKTSVVGML